MDTGQSWGWGTRGDPREWQNPTASPRGHDEDDDDEALLHAGKGTLLETFPEIFTNATTASLYMQPPNPAWLFSTGVCTPRSLLLLFCKPSLLH